MAALIWNRGGATGYRCAQLSRSGFGASLKTPGVKVELAAVLSLCRVLTSLLSNTPYYFRRLPTQVYASDVGLGIPIMALFMPNVHPTGYTRVACLLGIAYGQNHQKQIHLRKELPCYSRV